MGDRENKKILLVDIKKYRITEKLKDACISMGFEKSNIFVTSEAEAEDFSDFFEYYYVTAGNTFEILKEIRIKKLSGLIKRSMLENNATYIGSSAGAMLTILSIPPEKKARITDISTPISALNISPSCLA